MRIATGLHSPQLGGSQIATIDLAARLRQRGHSVEMFVIEQDFKTSALPLAERAGFDVEILPAESTLRGQAAHIRSFVERHDSQVTHVYHEHHWLGALVALALRPMAGRSPVVTNWMMENHRWIPPYAPLIVGFESIRDEAKKLQRGPVWLIEPPVDIDLDKMDPPKASEFRAEHGFTDSEILVIMATRIDRDMKLESILRSIAAIELVADSKVRFAIVGDGDSMDLVQDRVKETNDRLGFAAVHLTGALQNPRPAYSASDIVLGMGGSAIRALAFAKPVVVLGAGSFSKTFDADTLPHFLRDGFYGADEGDEAGEILADQIRSLLDPARRAELGAFGLRTVSERYSLDVMCDRLEDVYRQAIAHPPSALKRNADAAYVYGYDLSHRVMPPVVKRAIRQRIPRLKA